MVDNTNWYIVGSTLILVAITAYYAYQTRLLARRPFTPFVSASLNMVKHGDARDERHGQVDLNITNVGTGTATEVKVEHSVPAQNIAGQTTSFASILPGVTELLPVPITFTQNEDRPSVHLKYEYKDIFGHKYKREEDV